MIQQYQNYTAEDHEVWNLLYTRQVQNLQGKGCETYLNCVEQLKPAMNETKVPDFNDLNKKLKEATGWQIEVVPGLIPVEDFFVLLANKKFCASTWLRKKSQLDYLEEPDMFHDVFGHIPLLMDPSYSNFAQKLGEVGNKYLDKAQIILNLQRLYWFTIEFGLKQGLTQPTIYGAGILSSFGESNYIYDAKPEILPYDFDAIINRPFKTDEIQPTYFLIDSYDSLFNSLEVFDRKMNSV